MTTNPTKGTIMTTTLTDQQTAVIAEVEAKLMSGRYFGHRSTIAFENGSMVSQSRPMLTNRHYGKIIETLGRMAQYNDKMAWVARGMVTKGVNLHGTAYDAMSRLYEAALAVLSKPYDDVAARSGPEPVRHSDAQQDWNLRDRITVAMFLTEIEANLSDRLGGFVGVGWAVDHLWQAEGKFNGYPKTWFPAIAATHDRTAASIQRGGRHA